MSQWEGRLVSWAPQTPKVLGRGHPLVAGSCLACMQAWHGHSVPCCLSHMAAKEDGVAKPGQQQ